MNRRSYFNTMKGIEVVCQYNTYFAVQAISKAVLTPETPSRLSIRQVRVIWTVQIGAGIKRAPTSVQDEAGIQVFVSMLLPCK